MNNLYTILLIYLEYSIISISNKLLLIKYDTVNLSKPDYAILLLAAHIGLRSSDIVSLTFKDINYTEKTIEIIQSKTEHRSCFIFEIADDYMLPSIFELVLFFRGY